MVKIGATFVDADKKAFPMYQGKASSLYYFC